MLYKNHAGIGLYGGGRMKEQCATEIMKLRGFHDILAAGPNIATAGNKC